ncbi:MAG: hypothetical protein EOP06_18705 [Proteobacteria bacterium]|nr:MAG: hypothetical protein EOP06_18705 [Pseudomonadota bacterium]
MSRIFTQAVTALSLSELKKVVDSNPEIAEEVNEFELKYPKVPLSLIPVEIESLYEYIVRDSHKVNIERSVPFTPFEKLLLAVLWKNGHIDRVQSLMDGISGVTKANTDFGVIFRQFGRSLVDESEPIVDQHTIRAFCKFGDVSMVSSRKVIPRKSVFRNSDQPLINAYRQWFKSILDKVPIGERAEFKYLLDKILFAVGKALY